VYRISYKIGYHVISERDLRLNVQAKTRLII